MSKRRTGGPTVTRSREVNKKVNVPDGGLGEARSFRSERKLDGLRVSYCETIEVSNGNTFTEREDFF